MSSLVNKAAGIIIQDRRLLVGRSKGKSMFISPGGKLEAGEIYEQALCRELKEEFLIDVSEADLEYFGEFQAPLPDNDSVTVNIRVFMVKAWKGNIQPSSEIEEVAWFVSDDERPLASIFKGEVVPRLKSMDLID